MIRIALAAAMGFGLTKAALALETTPIADAQIDTAVTLSGSVARILDEDTFVLADPSGTIPVYIGPHPMPVAVEMAITVTGQIDDDLPRELYATQLILPGDRVIEVGGAYD
ncbi:MAG: hypothetical protein AAGK28_05575 [Pseudomonadota bacterium]